MFERESRPPPSRIRDGGIAALVRKAISSRGAVYPLRSGWTATRVESGRAGEQDYGIVALAKGAYVMTKAAQMRVATLLEGQWGANASIEHQPDGGLMVHLFDADGGRAVFVIDDESSPLLRIIGHVYINPQ